MKIFFKVLLLLVSTNLFALDFKSFKHHKLKSIPAMTKVKSAKKFSVFAGKIRTKDTYGEELKVKFDYYKPHNNKRAVLYLLPPISGLTLFDKQVAKHYAKKGYHVFITHLPDSVTNVKRSLMDVNKVFVRGINGLSTVIDIAYLDPNIDQNKVAIIGLSLGGIISSLALGVEKRIKAGILWLAGGDLANIIAYSKNPTVEKFREARMKKEKIKSQEGVYKYLKRNFKYDPLYYAKYRDPSDLMLFIAKKDRFVMTKNQYKLWESFGKPRVIDQLVGHLVAPFSLPFQLKKMDKHLERVLN